MIRHVELHHPDRVEHHPAHQSSPLAPHRDTPASSPPSTPASTSIAMTIRSMVSADSARMKATNNNAQPAAASPGLSNGRVTQWNVLDQLALRITGGDGAIATSTDAGCGFATDAFHEGSAQRTDRTGIGNVWGFREIVEIPFIEDDP